MSRYKILLPLSDEQCIFFNESQLKEVIFCGGNLNDESQWIEVDWMLVVINLFDDMAVELTNIALSERGLSSTCAEMIVDDGIGEFVYAVVDDLYPSYAEHILQAPALSRIIDWADATLHMLFDAISGLNHMRSDIAISSIEYRESVYGVVVHYEFIGDRSQ